VLAVLSSEHDRTTYLAEQDQTRRLVTLDVVRVPPDEGNEGAERCRERLRALMGWVHPGVPRVIDGRRTPFGDFCVVAHYATGPQLDRYCNSRDLDPGNRASLFATVCDTVSHGHQHGICHGRLRPDSIIVSGSREEVVPVVLGYSVIPGRVPTIGDDVSGLEIVARAMGWQGPEGRAWCSVDALREASQQRFWF
jgi:serine/threonine protein kinase